MPFHPHDSNHIHQSHKIYYGTILKRCYFYISILNQMDIIFI